MLDHLTFGKNTLKRLSKASMLIDFGPRGGVALETRDEETKKFLKEEMLPKVKEQYEHVILQEENKVTRLYIKQNQPLVL